MFTGIVQERGQVVTLDRNQSGAEIEIRCRRILDGLDLGDSVSIDGVCLTVTAKKESSFCVKASPETLRCTNLDDRRQGDRVNLEPAATLDGVLGGHLVQGHVDQTGMVTSVAPDGNSWIYRIAAPPEIMQHCVPKGSITVNGVSLTISKLEAGGFEVTIIPHTYEMTGFQTLQQGDRVNLEADVLSKYVQSHVRRILGTASLLVWCLMSPLVGGPVDLGPRSILVYAQHTQRGESQFVIRLARFHPDIFLEWESQSQQGTLQLYEKAVRQGRKFSLNGLFEAGVDVESGDVMTLWLSQDVYRNLMEDGRVKLSLNRIPARLTLEGEATRSVKLDRESRILPVIRLRDDRNGRWLILKDPTNPLLVEYESEHFRQVLHTVSTAPDNKLRWIRKAPPVR